MFLLRRLGLVLLMVCCWAGAAEAARLVEPPVHPGLAKALEYYAKTGQATAQVVDGVLMLPYGVGRTPEILCAPYQVCLVTLEAGEVLRAAHLGLLSTWNIEVESVGQEGTPTFTQSVVLKSTFCDQRTSLSIFTSKRRYHLSLRSLPCGGAEERGEVPDVGWVPETAFWYPQEALRGWAEAEVMQQRKETVEVAEAVEVEPEATVVCERYGYRWRSKRKFPWEPTVICDDGEHTYVGIPEGAAEMGVLFEVRGSAEAIVNYVVEDGYLKTEHLVRHARIRIGRSNGKDRILEIESRR